MTGATVWISIAKPRERGGLTLFETWPIFLVVDLTWDHNIQEETILLCLLFLFVGIRIINMFRRRIDPFGFANSNACVEPIFDEASSIWKPSTCLLNAASFICPVVERWFCDIRRSTRTLPAEFIYWRLPVTDIAEIVVVIYLLCLVSYQSDNGQPH